jgi:hypothetical protein
MERVHDVSDQAKKAEGATLRRSAGPQVRPGAGALLNLQRAAGNQAVARMLAASTNDTQPAANDLAPPITVQRQDQLEGFIKTAMAGDYVDMKDFAEKLVLKLKEPSAAAKSTASATLKGTEDATKAEAANLASLNIPTKEALAARKQELDADKAKLLRQARIAKGLLTPEERERQAQAKELKRLEEELRLKRRPLEIQEELRLRQQKLKDGEKAYEDRLNKLQQTLTEPEVELRNKNEELDVLEQQKKKKEEQEALGRERKTQARLLNPKGKSLSGLLGKRML